MSITDSGAFIREVKKAPQIFYTIHYSCQSLYDDNEGLSPRITSIAITHYATGQAVSFSTHSIAEELRIGREDVLGNFDAVELQLLTGFISSSVTGATSTGCTGICETLPTDSNTLSIGTEH